MAFPSKSEIAKGLLGANRVLQKICEELWVDQQTSHQFTEIWSTSVVQKAEDAFLQLKRATVTALVMAC